MNIKEITSKLIGKTVNAVSNTVAQTEQIHEITQTEVTDDIKECCRRASAQGMVLLKNEAVLPFSSEQTVAVFGRVQVDTFYVGYGSGGEVKAPYKVSFADGLEVCENLLLDNTLLKKYRKWCSSHKPDEGYWGHWPMHYDEMPLTEEDVKNAAKVNDRALFIIGRAAGEDRENTLSKGSFLLTDREEEILRYIAAHFEKYAVILNIGSIMDCSWIEKYNVPCVLIAWQGGMEAGNALADVISGKVSPCGCLTDTIASSYADYPSSGNFGGKKENIYAEDIFVGYRYFETFAPEKVLYPFGHGLSYSDFEMKCTSFYDNDKGIFIRINIKNTGLVAAAKVAQIYCACPQGRLGQPFYKLVDFGKTKILSPGSSEDILFSVDYSAFASFDDSGLSGYRNSYVLEQGTYVFYFGSSVKDIEEAGSIEKPKTTVLESLTECSAPQKSFMRMKAYSVNGKVYKTTEPVPVKEKQLKTEILSALPSSVKMCVGHRYVLDDVKNGKVSEDEFISLLSYDELEALSRGDYVMNSPLGINGNAGVFGGVTDSLREKGIPAVSCTDGPSGIRCASEASLLPNGTSLACTWDVNLVKEIYSYISDEMVQIGTDVLLAPGMNIHRDPLCGRNFEYYSEDPLLTGRIAAAAVSGIQSNGVSACPKHFACNNQETNRTVHDSVVSQRALREIYLKGFEICVKTAKPMNIMTSYNKINSVWGHYNYELVTDILRGEWNYNGNVITDWWMQSSSSPEFPSMHDQAYRVRAGVNILMPGGGRTGKRNPDGTLLDGIDKEGHITTAELQNNARRILEFILRLSKQEEQI